MLSRKGKHYFYHNDNLGTPQVLTDSNGEIVWQASYDAFGKARVAIDKVINNLRFPGQYFDQESGLDYNFHRFYDPETGRYVSADPIGLAGGMNLYAYVENDPVNWIDPWGLRFAESWGAGGAAIGGTIVAGGSLVVDAATGGLNILATPGEIALGSAIGGTIGYGLGGALDWMMNEGDDSAPPVEKKRPRRFKKKDRDDALEECKDENGDPRCAYCGSKLHTTAGHANSYEADHGNPYSQGGESTKENLYPSCRTCNRSKGGKTIDEWLGQ